MFLRTMMRFRWVALHEPTGEDRGVEGSLQDNICDAYLSTDDLLKTDQLTDLHFAKPTQALL